MQNRDDIFNTLRDALVELFELEPERVTLDANLYQAACLAVTKAARLATLEK